MSIFVSGALVPAKSHFTIVENNCKIIQFKELFIWVAREHQLSQLFDALGGSCWLLGPLWAHMVPPGGSWRKFMKTMFYEAKRMFFIPQGLS